MVDRGPGGRLIGREAVLGLATAVLDDALGGGGQLLVVTGEPGMGKSAVLAELARRASERGARVLRGTCWDGAGTPPYWPWTQVVRGLDPAELGEAGRLVADGPRAAAGSAPDAADERFRMFDAVATALVRLSRTAPVAVVLDDLQWADGPSLDLVRFVAGQVAAERVLVLCAYRDTEPSAAPSLGGQVLALAGLSTSEVSALVTTVAGSRPSPQRAAEVRRRCGGNPFFVRELTRLVLARGGWDRDAAAEPLLPDGVRDTLAQRLDRLSPPCRALLEAAAVAGPRARAQVLARVSGRSAEECADLLDEAVRARVAVREDGVRIAHDLFREAILAALPSSRRADLHAAVGRALADPAVGGTGADLAAVLAAHFAAAGPAAAAESVRFCLLAGAEATRRLGHEDAARHYETALRLLPASAVTERVAALLALAAARDRAGETGAARTAYRQAAELARPTDPAALALAALGLHALGGREEAAHRETADLLTEAAAALAPADGPAVAGRDGMALRSRVAAALARTHRHSRLLADEARATAAAREAVVMAEVAGDDAALAGALLAAHDAAWRPGAAAERLALTEAMAAAATRAGDADLVAEASLLKAAALLEIGDPAGRAELDRYARLADDLGHRRGRWGALTRRATLAALGGRVDEAVELSTAGRRLGRAIGVPDADAVFGTLRTALSGFGIDRAAPGADDDVPTNDPLWPMQPLLRASLCLARGDRDGASAALRGFAVDDIAGGGVDLELLAIAAPVCAAAGSLAQRRWLYDRLAPHAGLHVVAGGCAAYHGAVDHHLGLLAAALSRPEAAVRHLVAAEDMYERLGAPAWARLCRGQREAVHDVGPRNQFRRDGTRWRLAFDGSEAELPDAKGMHDLAALLAAPGRPVHVLALLGLDAPPTGADAILDASARTAYAQRLARLEEEVAEADLRADAAASARACAERDALLAELKASTGLGGRPRRLGAEVERARKTVRARINDALLRIERVHPVLGLHLRATVNTGTTCMYAPPAEVRWRT